MSVKSKNDERSEAMRTLLLDVAERLFARDGFAGTATEALVAEAGVTRGALYHHFRDKRDVFRGVFIRIEERMIDHLAGEAAGQPDAFAALQRGAHAFLDLCMDPVMHRIALVDAPSVLGWEEWHAIEERYALGLVRTSLEAAMESGQLARRPIAVLAQMLLGALNEAAMLLARADDRDAARAEVGETLDGLLSALCVGAPEPPKLT